MNVKINVKAGPKSRMGRLGWDATKQTKRSWHQERFFWAFVAVPSRPRGNASAQGIQQHPGALRSTGQAGRNGDALREWASDYAAHFMIKSAL